MIPMPVGMFGTGIMVIRPYPLPSTPVQGIVGALSAMDDVSYVALRVARPGDYGASYGVSFGAYSYTGSWSGQVEEDIATAIAADINANAVGYEALAAQDLVVIWSVDDSLFDLTTTGPISVAGSVFEIQASVQPFYQGRERKILEEGQREMEIIAVLTPTQLFTVEERTGKKADIVLYNHGTSGLEQYEVRQVDHYQMGTLDHNDATCVRVVRGTYR